MVKSSVNYLCYDFPLNAYCLFICLYSLMISKQQKFLLMQLSLTKQTKKARPKFILESMIRKLSGECVSKSTYLCLLAYFFLEKQFKFLILTKTHERDFK